MEKIIMEQAVEAPTKQEFETVSLDDLARERLSSATNESINQLELFVAIRYKDEYIAIKADKNGFQLNSKVRFLGFGAVLLGLGGLLIKHLI